MSVRTVLRDVETLSASGVPIFAVQGAGGGIELLDGFRTQLTGLTAEEATPLFLTGQPALAGLLGLKVEARTARRKLLLTKAIRAQVEVSWPGTGSQPPQVLRPLGLVLEAGRWHLVQLSADGPCLHSLSEA